MTVNAFSQTKHLTHCYARSGRIYDVRFLDVGRLETVDDADDVMATLRARRLSLHKRVLELEADPHTAYDDLHKARRALDWCNRRLSEAKAHRDFLVRDGNQSWSTLTVAQHFMRAAQAHIGSETYAIILAEAQKRSGATSEVGARR